MALQLDPEYENAILLKEFIVEKKKYCMDPYSSNIERSLDW
jgi:hypothetical protein